MPFPPILSCLSTSLCPSPCLFVSLYLPSVSPSTTISFSTSLTCFVASSVFRELATCRPRRTITWRRAPSEPGSSSQLRALLLSSALPPPSHMLLSPSSMWQCTPSPPCSLVCVSSCHLPASHIAYTVVLCSSGCHVCSA